MSDAQPPFERTTVTAPDGATLAVFVTGRGEPLLLIAGQALDHRAWDPVLPAFAPRFQVITYDHRGTGESTGALPVGWSTRDFARDAAAVLDGLRVPRAHVYGHSMGGRVAQWLAADAPDRVGALVLGGTTGGDARGVPRPAEATAALVRGDPRALAELCFTDAYLARTPDALALVTSSAPAEARRAHLAASTAHDAWDALPRISAPSLVVHGEDDRVCVVENGRRLARALPRSEPYVVVAGRHAYYVDVPAANERVIAFLGAHPLHRLSPPA